jgi:hypothetical protein
MTKSVCILAVLAAAVSTSAVAQDDLKQKAPAVSGIQMSDSEMDRVTAGTGHAFGHVCHPAWHCNGHAFGHSK